MNRYDVIFKELKYKHEGCFVPFVTIGYPSIQFFYKIIDNLLLYGSNALELGIPFSDPLADGSIIQKSNSAALNNGITVSRCFKIIQKIRIKYSHIPIGILVYANMVFNYGIKNFYKLCAITNIDSVLIPDIPIEEYLLFKKHADFYNISSIFIVPPNSSKQLIQKIAYLGTGYIYLTTRSGVTGLKNTTFIPNVDIIKELKNNTSVPILQGFGISKPSQIKLALSSGINGIICGSIIIKVIQKYQSTEDIMLKKIKELVKIFKMATKI
ncbi:Tryptophan synthase alpha chain [Buchnera aphidicola (Pterocallis alni)]|uniref:tryptophan synthase subunit alpha n=1 Tax=Buchnera aphidicola TaxID=9 RepID=UPI003463CEA4